VGSRRSVYRHHNPCRPFISRPGDSAPGANWRNSWADTRGNGYDIFLIFLGAFLPLIAFGFFVALILLGPIPNWGAGTSTPAMITVNAVFSAMGYILAVVVASSLYGQLASKLKQA
jgi:hypothetical protein